jgi:hypothetical protein
MNSLGVIMKNIFGCLGLLFLVISVQSCEKQEIIDKVESEIDGSENVVYDDGVYDAENTVEDEATEVISVASEDQGKCPKKEDIRYNDKRFTSSRGNIFVSENYFARARGTCEKKRTFSDGSKETIDSGYEYIEIVPRRDVYSVSRNSDNGNIIEIRFQNIKSEEILINEEEIVEVFGSDRYVVMSGWQLVENFTRKENINDIRQSPRVLRYSNKFYYNGETRAENSLFNEIPQVYDYDSQILTIDTTENSELFEKWVKENSIDIIVSIRFPENYSIVDFTHILQLPEN